jgi:hypothetical protein
MLVCGAVFDAGEALPNSRRRLGRFKASLRSPQFGGVPTSVLGHAPIFADHPKVLPHHHSSSRHIRDLGMRGHQFQPRRLPAFCAADAALAGVCIAVVELFGHQSCKSIDFDRADYRYRSALSAGPIIGGLGSLVLGFQGCRAFTQDIVQFDDAVFDRAVEGRKRSSVSATSRRSETSRRSTASVLQIAGVPIASSAGLSGSRSLSNQHKQSANPPRNG